MDNKVQHIQVPHDLGVAKEIKMNPTDYLIYGYMRKNMDKDTFQTFVSLRTLAELARVSINTVQSSIKKLNAAGEIKILEKKKVGVIFMRFKNREDILKDLLTSLWMLRILLLKKKEFY